MKYALTFLFLLTYFCSFGQLLDELPKDSEGKLNYNEVVQVEGASQQELYLRAKQFFANTFKSANNVIQLDDKDAGILIGKGFSEVPVYNGFATMNVPMWYTIKLQGKDGRYKYEVYDIYFKTKPTTQAASVTYYPEDIFIKEKYFKKNGTPRLVNKNYKEAMEAEAASITRLLKAAMSKPVAGKDNDW